MRILIVDDEAPARSRMRRLLAAYPEVECVGEAENGLQALNLIESLAPDVVFLDVEMPELNGIATATAMAEDGPSVVFVTAFDQYALAAFEVSAVDYLVKPVDKSRLAATIDRLRKKRTPARASTDALSNHMKLPSTRMAIRSGSRYAVFDVARVTAVVARDSYSAFIVDGEEHLSDDSLERLEQRLDPQLFMRVHRSGIINIKRIIELIHEGDRKYTAKLSDGTRVPISRSKLDEVKRRFAL